MSRAADDDSFLDAIRRPDGSLPPFPDPSARCGICGRVADHIHTERRGDRNVVIQADPVDAADVERVARAMCRAENLDPDRVVYAGIPIQVGAYHYATSGPGMPLWETRAQAAAVAIAEFEKICGEAP